MKKISIVVRTKNEERWINQCLSAVFSQKFYDFEVIIVDNESIDNTVEKAKRFNVAKIISCKDYRPGKALNLGIEQARGEYIACLSGHCIPVNERWLENLLKNFHDDPQVVGVYGKQEPMSFSSDSDKRDLALVFGLDRKVQLKDSLFHNANSMIRKDVLKKIPFDEIVTNIEDRVWAQKALAEGYKIIYEPEASVYHYHGIHQNGDIERCTNVVRVLEGLQSDYGSKIINIEKLNIVALIPVRGPVQYLNDRPLLAYTVKRALESKYIKRVIVSTDNAELAGIAKETGAEAPFLRDPKFSMEHIDLDRALQHSLKRIEDLKIFPDLVVVLEVTFPFRPPHLIDEMITQLAQKGLDSVITVKRENKAIWKEEDGRIIQLDEGLTPRQFKDPTFIEIRGAGFVTHPEFLREGSALGNNIGIYELNNPYFHLEVRSEDDFKIASLLVKKWLDTK